MSRCGHDGDGNHPELGEQQQSSSVAAGRVQRASEMKRLIMPLTLAWW
jgi:hypothetical protein